MKRLVIVLMMIVFVAGCGPKENAKSAKTDEKRDFVALGMMYLQKKDIKRAVMSFDQAIKMDPKNHANYVTLGRVYLNLKNVDRAIDTFQAAVKVDPMQAETNLLLATSYLTRGNEGDAALAEEFTKRSALLYKKSNDKDGFVRSMAVLKQLQGDIQ